MSQSEIQLHLIQNQFSFEEFKQMFLRLTSYGDSILFLNDSLFLLIDNEFNSDVFINLTKQTSILTINEQLQARNIKALINNNVQTIDYPHFVKLTNDAHKVISW